MGTNWSKATAIGIYLLLASVVGAVCLGWGTKNGLDARFSRIEYNQRLQERRNEAQDKFNQGAIDSMREIMENEEKHK